MKVLVFGATGNIGQQTIAVIKQLKHQLVGISFYNNNQVAKRMHAKYKFSPINHKLSNVKSYEELITVSKPDMIVNALVGFSGLEITLLAIKHRIDLALANKESLVVAGRFIMPMANKNKINIYPIDSEHASLQQILSQVNKPFNQLYITASGGPFYKYSAKQLANVTYKQTIHHPTWHMGWKISIDSATLINKCFEIIEAYWYFRTKKITPLYHPQSFVHAIVEFKNKVKYVFASKADMHLPIILALNRFRGTTTSVKPLVIGKYTLETIHSTEYPPIKWAYQCLKNPASSLPIIINAANDWATLAFKNGTIKFNEIVPTIANCITKFKKEKIKNLQGVFSINEKVIHYLKKII